MPTGVLTARGVVPAKDQVLVSNPGSASFRKELVAEVVLVLTDLTYGHLKIPPKVIKPILAQKISLSSFEKMLNVNHHEIGIDFLNKLLFSARPSSKYCLYIGKCNELTQLLKERKLSRDLNIGFAVCWLL